MAWAAFEQHEDQLQVAFLNALVFTDSERLAAIACDAREVNRAQGRQLRKIADFLHDRMADPEPGRFAQEASESAAAEIGLTLGLAAPTASDWTRLALGLSQRLPIVLASLEDGAITLSTARVLLEETASLSPGDAAAIAAALLDNGGGRTPSTLRKMVRRRVIAKDVDAARKRREAAVRERDVRVTRIEGDNRPSSARRADALRDVILHPDETHPRAVLVLHLHGGEGNSGAIAELPGYGPVVARSTRDAADLIRRASTTEKDLAATLATLDASPDTYVPSAALTRAIQARDKHCRFPGCHVPARRCELDHTIEFGNGTGGRTI